MTKTYNVTLVEMIRYTITVEADSEAEASEAAQEVWAAELDPIHEFAGEPQGVQTATVLEVKNDGAKS